MLETKDLILKIGEYEDWKDMYDNLWQHEKSARYMLWTPLKSEKDAQNRMRASIEFQEKNDLAYFVYEKISGKAIGFAGMKEIAPGVYEDTGIAVGPDFARKGYGAQIVEALLNCAFEEKGAGRFVYSCRSKNVASKRLAEHCGFIYTHSEDKVDRRNGEPYVLDYFERVKKEK